MNKTLKKIIIILVVLILIVIGASFFSGEGGGTENPLQSLGTGTTGSPLATTGTTVTAGNTNTAEINREFISILLNLESIDLNDDIFSEPAFIALVDNTVRLNQPGNEGRPNPFAPIGVDGLYTNGLGASASSFDDGAMEASVSGTPNTTQDQTPINLEGVDSSDDLTDEQLDEALSSLGSS